MKFILIFKQKMNVPPKIMDYHTITVCMGPGCEAWESISLFGKLEFLLSSKGQINLEQGKCLNNCGGGASVKLSKDNKLFKIRNLDEFCDNILPTLLAQK